MARQPGGAARMKKSRIAVIQFPGLNCEDETRKVLQDCGMAADIIRWTADHEALDSYDGFVIPGGWSYEDRIRAGVLASKNPLLIEIKRRCAKGAPVLGICNGAQVLVEAGLVPGLSEEGDVALAPNKNPVIRGYYCTWTWVRVRKGKETAFNRRFKEGQVFQIPIAHAEGRFTAEDPAVFTLLERKGHIALQYCDPQGRIIDAFPVNPNGTMLNIAALTNGEGTALAIMPHPERASYRRQVPGFAGDFKAGESAAPARAIFESMRDYLEARR